MAEGFYDLLGVARDADVDEVKRAYKRMALKHHPDKGGDAEQFKAVTRAFENLSDAATRAAYDRTLLRSRSTDGQGRGTARRHGSMDARRVATPEGRRPSEPRQTEPVDIPADLTSLTAREIKVLLTKLGVRYDDCVEKSELLERLREKAGRRDWSDKKASPASAWSATSPTRKTAPAAPKGKGAIRTKIVSLGAPGVGKSCLIKRYCEGRFVSRYISTIGVDYGVKEVVSRGRQVKVNFFDLAGADGFKSIRSQFYDNTCGGVCVFDVTQAHTFRELHDWLQEAREHGVNIRKGEAPFFAVCANKVDLPGRQVSHAEGKRFAEDNGMGYFETSAASGAGVQEAIHWICERCVDHVGELRRRHGID